MSKTLVFSRKKNATNLLYISEDLKNFYDLKKISLTFQRGIIFLHLSFPEILFVSNNCFYAPKFINLRVSISIIQKQLSLFLKGLSQGFFLEFRLVGLGFKLKKSAFFLQKLLKFDIGFSHFIKLPLANIIKLFRTKKRFMLFSNDYQTLQILLKNIRNIRAHNPYKLRGLKLTGFKFRIKPGKKQNKR